VEVVLAIALLVGGPLFFAAVVFVVSRTNWQRWETIVAAMREVGATDVRTRSFGLLGTVRGVPVRWDALGGARGHPVHTMCSVSLVHPPRFLMDVRQQTGEELEQVRAGRAVDVIVDDQAFDDAFIVEAAPSDVAKKLLDAEIRRMLLAMRPVRLCVAKNTLWLDVMGVVGHEAIAKSMLELVLSMTRRLGEIPLAIAEERMTAEAREAPGAAYRGTTPGSAEAMDAWSPQGEKDLATLLLARKRRQQRAWKTTGIGIVLYLAFAATIVRCMR
jgi:hypothetical protein